MNFLFLAAPMSAASDRFDPFLARFSTALDRSGPLPTAFDRYEPSRRPMLVPPSPNRLA
jgi:hypothetical protein